MVNFAIPAEHRVKLKEIQKKESTLTLKKL